MDGGTRNLNALAQRRFVDPQAIEAFTAEGGNQRGVHIDDSLGIFGGKAGRQDAHKACQNNEPDSLFLQFGCQGFLKSLLGPKLLFGDHAALNPGLLCPFQSKGPRVVGNHQLDFAADQFSPALGIHQGLQIGSAAGYQHRDFGFHSRITFSSFSTISPMT